MEPSVEQCNILNQLINTNVVVDSVAGCGKTTTIKYVSMAFRRDNILVLTYNYNQRKKSREEFRKLNLKNITVHTFHSFVYHNYDNTCSRDEGIRKIIGGNIPPSDSCNYNILIFDEVQDMTDLYYQLTLKIIRDFTNGTPRILILGDYLQCINTFNGSDIDYITNPEKYYNGDWSHCNLNETFRLTPEMALFVNNVMSELGESRELISNKPNGVKPQYYICDVDFIYFKILEYLTKYEPNDIMIISPSTKKDNRVNNLCNMLTSKRIPLYVSGDRESRTDTTTGKLLVSTINAVKGDERPVIMLLNFDDSILPKMMNKDKSPNAIIYVALTRAKRELLVFHHEKNAFIVKRSVIESCCDFKIETKLKIKDEVCLKPKTPLLSSYSVTDLVKYISNDIKMECMKYINVSKIRDAGDNIATGICNIVTSKVNGSQEEVSDINGFLIPAYHSRFSFNFKVLKDLFHKIHNKGPSRLLVDGYIRELISVSDDILFDDDYEICKLLRAVTIYLGLRNNLLFRIEQIAEYNWITKESLNACNDRLNELLTISACFEVPVEISMTDNINIVGIIDVIDSDIVYELKCTSMLEEEHILQLALYSLLVPGKIYRLYNIYTDELLEINITDATMIANILINKKV